MAPSGQVAPQTAPFASPLPARQPFQSPLSPSSGIPPRSTATQMFDPSLLVLAPLVLMADAVGNPANRAQGYSRTMQTATITSTQVTNYVYDAANRLTSVNGQTYMWDDNGNLLNDGATQYAYPAKSAGPAAIKPIA